MRAEPRVRKGANAPQPPTDDARQAAELAKLADQAQPGAEPDHSAARVRISEIYASRQGEGRWTGTPSVFLRISGCNLRCWFCDTPFASWHPEGEFFSVDEILDRVLAFSEPDVVITGGEPLITPRIGEISRRLRQAGRRVTIETAGTVDQDFECDLLSISPKLASSAPDAATHAAWHATHNQRRQRVDLVRRWLESYDVQLKFVVSTLADAQEVLAYLGQLGSVDANRVWLMPEGTTAEALERRAEWLVPWCGQHGFHYCPRSHILWYGNRRGT